MIPKSNKKNTASELFGPAGESLSMARAVGIVFSFLGVALISNFSWSGLISGTFPYFSPRVLLPSESKTCLLSFNPGSQDVLKTNWFLRLSF